ncbi:MAG: condensation domain-containing protein, partial [Bacteroidetes bacterium]|nr:condensation domain-containing protein [Bacteroidota bacterium]
SDAAPSEAIERCCNAVQSSVELESGPLLRLGLLQLQEGSRLLIVIHHLVVDGISWRILLEDIETLLGQYAAEAPLQLPAKTDSVQYRTNSLKEYLNSKKYADARKYWEANTSHTINVNLPADTDLPQGKIESIQRVHASLDERMTQLFLKNVPERFNTGPDDLLLTALQQCFQKMYGIEQLWVELEGHGREDIMDGTDIGRTVGWFTSVYPVCLNGLKEGETMSAGIKRVKEILRHVPNKGMDYLLWLGIDHSFNGTIQRAPVSYNYLGQFDTDTQSRYFRIAEESAGNNESAANPAEYQWEFNGMVSGGVLQLSFGYSTDQYYPETAEKLMQLYKRCLEELIEYCNGYDRNEFTPSDTSYPVISMEELDRLQAQYRLQDVYPLSPLQEGMLFHSLYETEGDQYFEQLSYTLTGNLDVVAVRKSVELLMKRYAVLRTLFLYEGLEKPLQVVLKEKEADITFKDISQLKRAEADKVAQLVKRQDRKRNFDLGNDALLRLTLIKTSETAYLFIWSFHHIIMDGWCMSIIVRDFNAFYAHHTEGKPAELPTVKPYATYIQWLGNIDRDSGRAFWKNYLEGYETLATIPNDKSITTDDAGYIQSSKELFLNNALSNQLKNTAATLSLTVNTLIQVAWGILLSRFNNTDDVVFGSVVSGRPAAIEGVEDMVGLFINTIPVRVCYDGNESVAELAQRIQTKAIEAEPYHYHPLAEIQASSLPERSLLDHILVFENYPVSAEVAGAAERRQAFTIQDVEMFEQTNYPCTLVIYPGERLLFRMDYNSERYSEGLIGSVLSCLERIIEVIADKSENRIRDISLLNEAE